MEIVRLQQSDVPGVTALMNKYFAPKDDAAGRRGMGTEYYCWKFSENPCGSPVFFLYKQKGEIAGLIGAMPMPLRVRGETFIGFETADAFVAPEAQGKGVFLALSAALYEELDDVCPLYFVISSTPKSRAIGKRKHSYYAAMERRNLVLALNPRSAFVSMGAPPGISAVLGPIASGIVGLKSVARRRGARLLKEVLEIDSFPADYDEFRKSLPSDYDFETVKSRAFMEWRYVTCPEPYRFFQCKLRSGEVGYFVFKDDVWRTSKVGYVIDVTANVRNRDVRLGLIAGIIDVMQEEKIDLASIELNSEHPLFGDLLKSGFIARRERIPFMIRQKKYDFLVPGAPEFDVRRWNVLTGDGTDI